MTRAHNRYSGSVVAAFLLVTTGAFSCSKPAPGPVTRQKFTAESEDAVVGQPPAHLGGPNDGVATELVKGRRTPELPQPIESMSDTALVAYLRMLQYDADPVNSELVAATCVHTAPPRARCSPYEAALVYIQPDVGVHRWGRDIVPPNGFVVARVINYDNERQDAHFGFPPQSRVWWVVDHDSGGAARSRFFVRTYSPTAPAVRQVGATRPFTVCPHWTHAPTEAAAKFRSCATSRIAMTPRPSELQQAIAAPYQGSPFQFVSFPSAVSIPAIPRPAMEISDGWVTCPKGCCSTM